MTAPLAPPRPAGKSAPRPAIAAPPGDDRRRYRMTEPQYLAFEEAQTELKHEWANGTVIEMAGATEQHEDLALAFAAMLREVLKGRDGKAYGSNLRVRTGAGTRRYPDASAVVGPRRFAPHPRDKRLDLLNPAVLVEILSDSTAATDDGEKLADYAATPSVRDYVIADGRRMHVVHRTRTGPDEPWTKRTLTDPGDVLELASVGLKTTLAELYDGVEL